MPENQLKLNFVIADLIAITEVFRDDLPACAVVRLEAAVESVREVCQSL